jgi:hypothetical protein
LPPLPLRLPDPDLRNRSRYGRRWLDIASNPPRVLCHRNPLDRMPRLRRPHPPRRQHPPHTLRLPRRRSHNAARRRCRRHPPGPGNRFRPGRYPPPSKRVLVRFSRDRERHCPPISPNRRSLRLEHRFRHPPRVRLSRPARRAYRAMFHPCPVPRVRDSLHPARNTRPVDNINPVDNISPVVRPGREANNMAPANRIVRPW